MNIIYFNEECAKIAKKERVMNEVHNVLDGAIIVSCVIALAVAITFFVTVF